MGPALDSFVKLCELSLLKRGRFGDAEKMVAAFHESGAVTYHPPIFPGSVESEPIS